MRGNKDSQLITSPLCNCRGRKKDPNVCPLNGKCQKTDIIHRADVTSNGDEKIYIGSTGTSFKTRYTQHKASLTHKDHSNQTTLSTYCWQEKAKGNSPSIKWSIVKEIRGRYNRKNGCPLCNRERLEIASINKHKLLNRRYELKSGCPHHRNDFFPTVKPPRIKASLGAKR